MDVIDAIKSRRSIRSYAARSVEKEKLMACLEAARWAPSAGNRQPWELLVVGDSETKRRLAEVNPHTKFISQAPLTLVFIASPAKSSRTHHIDTSLAAMNFMLAAHAVGLGTCWAGVYDTDLEPPIRDLLGIPKELRVLCLMSLGYPDQSPTKDRLPLDEMTHWERYGNRKRPE